jgi:hypothetical protein
VFYFPKLLEQLQEAASMLQCTWSACEQLVLSKLFSHPHTALMPFFRIAASIRPGSLSLMPPTPPLKPKSMAWPPSVQLVPPK